MKRGTPEHPKMHLLATALAAEPYQHLVAVAVTELLWQYTAAFAPQGDIGRWPDDQIARAVRWPADPGLLIGALVQARWLDDVSGCERCRAHRLLVHDWPEHAEDAVHMRLARGGLAFADGTVPRLTRLNHVDKEQLVVKYRELPKPCARHAHSVRTVCALPKPKPPPPPPPLEEEEPPDSLKLVGPRAHSVRTESHRATAKLTRPRLRRLPSTETLTADRRQMAIEAGLPAARIDLEWQKLGDHEFASPRSDWTATWRNWVRGAVERLPRGRGDEPPDPKLEARLQAMNAIIVPRKERP